MRTGSGIRLKASMLLRRRDEMGLVLVTAKCSSHKGML